MTRKVTQLSEKDVVMMLFMLVCVLMIMTLCSHNLVMEHSPVLSEKHFLRVITLRSSELFVDEKDSYEDEPFNREWGTIEKAPKPKQAYYEEEVKLTAYCACSKCCGHNTGITASGAYVEQGKTIATSSSFADFGTEIEIYGHRYVVQDRGVKGNVIDIYFDSHEEALNFGVQYTTVKVFLEG